MADVGEAKSCHAATNQRAMIRKCERTRDFGVDENEHPKSSNEGGLIETTEVQQQMQKGRGSRAETRVQGLGRDPV